MNIQIKKAEEKDFKIIQGLFSLLIKKEQKDFDKTLKTDWPFSKEGEKYFQRVLSGEIGQAWLALMDGKEVGYLIGVIKKEVPKSRTIKKRAVLDNMFVLEKYRNQGVGMKLAQEFLKWVKENEVDNIRVTAFVGNYRALEFYRELGFKDYNLTLEIQR